MTNYPTREYIIRETTYPDATKQELIWELVRCKDCKHHHYEKHFDKRIPYCDRINYGYGWQDNDYCSRGERKEGEAHD